MKKIKMTTPLVEMDDKSYLGHDKGGTIKSFYRFKN